MTFTVLRKNKMGLDYKISQDNTQDFTTIWQGRRSIQVKADVGQINRGWYAWFHEDKLAQDAFPFLNHAEREFLISGITPDQWNEMFNSNGDMK